MAGFRTFATGEVLTAANVNDFLMKQSVMVFEDADARTAALGAEVIEGMLTYNKDTDQLEVFDGSAFVLAAPAPPAGIGSNVVSVLKTDAFTTSSSTYVDVTDLELTITPTTVSSKILLLFNVPFSGTGDNRAALRINRDGTDIVFNGGSNDAWAQGNFRDANELHRLATFASSAFLDSPATTSPVTYKVRASRGPGGTLTVNRTGRENLLQASTLTAIEVAA